MCASYKLYYGCELVLIINVRREVLQFFLVIYFIIFMIKHYIYVYDFILLALYILLANDVTDLSLLFVLEIREERR